MRNEKYVFYRSAHAVVVSPSGKFLVLVGSEWPERPDRSLRPDLIGGKIEYGESPEQGLIREITEESGLELDIDQTHLVLQVTVSAAPEIGYWHHYFYIARSTSESVTLSWEHVEHRWVDLDEFVAADWRPNQRKVVDYIYGEGLLE